MAKRTHAEVENEDSSTSKKLKQSARTPGTKKVTEPTTSSTHPRSILKGTPSNRQKVVQHEKTPGSGRVLFKSKIESPVNSPSKAKAARNDASARKKSAAVLQREALAEGEVDDEIDDGEIELAEEILAADEPGAAVSTENGNAPPSDAPVKRGRGRPKGSKRARTPTPPPDLPAHEWYFFRNRTTADKTSSNALPSHLLLNHEDYLAQIKTYDDPHAADIRRLKQLHERSFEQWQFELEEDFSVCLYGYGSKRNLLLDFAHYLHDNTEGVSKIIVVNGYLPTLGIKDVLALIAAQVLPKHIRQPNQVNILLEAVIKALDSHESRIFLIIHNLDSPALRRPAIQTMIARLAQHKNIAMIASCDNLNFGLLWDLNLLRSFNFAFHDATTFEPWPVEIDSVEEVNLLLGRSSRRLTGKDGVGFVLRSLPENARNLFRILVTEQLTQDVEYNIEAAATADSDDEILGVSDEEAAMAQNTPSRKNRGRPKKARLSAAKIAETEGVEYRALYHKAVEEFVCTSEVAFRQLLKEFHDHQMIQSRKDLMGTERLVVPFRREELEAILEEV